MKNWIKPPVILVTLCVAAVSAYAMMTDKESASANLDTAKVMVKDQADTTPKVGSKLKADVGSPDYAKTKQKLESVLGLKVLAIGDSPVPNLAQVSTNQGLFYASENGKYLVSGRIFNVDAGMRNETDVKLAELRIEGISDFSDEDVIEFKAKDEKYVINVFTDITCGYCRKLHREIDDYNDKGITVRYLAFPRGGLNTQTYYDMVAVWCADDKQGALTAAKTGADVDGSTCSNKVADEYAFGTRIGVNGTPNIILPDGSLVGGYMPADALLEKLSQI
ncbi:MULTISPECIES: thioredoxin fold domain-containing protein [Aliiglaciecola]|uniref:thioredoxin fold domain-containing protein n=1 Tax=Aliiglaciecola TaxID=1406885 RepID=UPI001C082B24|nr:MULTISPECIES: thioredoxin fold domain-containing protein [Aliiglaciecola]MBU2876931.1 thioredoxin fold domain-containing protein [Aliiglaciecola lipolytica]MDO6712621.1 thioredoxin fold domain-containing protein [Aliiglaciecola sp. 2_MG-2023]MDO6753771.1 thioredoxin fold domain-containing protein [Aliiglaciecola sp. 1_MG-2023]